MLDKIKNDARVEILKLLDRFVNKQIKPKEFEGRYEKLWHNINKQKIEMKFLYKSKKGTLNKIKSRLANGEELFFWYLDKKKAITYKTQINIWRLDIIQELKKYKKETYVIGIERGDSRWVLEEGNLIIDERHEFHTVEEIIDYLDKKDYLKRKDWIKE